MIDEIIALNRHIQKTNDHILSIAQNHFASLSIGFGKSSNDFLPGYIREFKNKQKNISISLSDICSYEQEEQLLSGALDIGFMRQPKSKDLHSIPVSSDEFVLAVAKDLYTVKKINYYLENFNLLMMSNHSKSMINIKTMTLLKGRAHNITNISADIQTIITLILSNAGVAILPKKSILGIYDAIKLIPFEEDTRWDIHMAWNPARTSKSVDLFIEFVQAASGQAGGLFEKV
ncbi:LysR family transcriptional regulator substrate-binding protein [Photobacterium atrarenae]|uniref:LysR family transcriptional regulator substrate-binding protein n=1 Tax=Photobacterium atrarenae TaxID=865757 RepID=A0ABY5GGZ3_9GAMM|nr:LysR family transcriptional regulator substrate-binding protein [Photobacterium atrarenae]UTV28446.1 LysR family transcriptional regulator substrate-binding protein [Photobacterium atrarenae]